MKRATILLSVGLLLVPMSLAGQERKYKKWGYKPLTPIQVTPDQRIDLKDFSAYAATLVNVIPNGSPEKIPLKIFANVEAFRPIPGEGADDEVWLRIVYAVGVDGQKPNLGVPDYIVITHGVQVIDGEGVRLERLSFARVADQVKPRTRELSAFHQENYLRERLTFSGSNLAQPEDDDIQGGAVIYRRADRRKTVGPFTVRIPVLDPGEGPNIARLFTFRFVDAP